MKWPGAGEPDDEPIRLADSLLLPLLPPVEESPAVEEPWMRRAGLVARIRELPASAFAVAAGLVALGIGCYQLSLPHVLTGVLGYGEGYDDGVYTGAAIRFVHGVMPYRDFVIVHPPGIVLLLSPFALLGSVTAAHLTVILARCLTVAVTAANPVLAGLLVRRGGRLAVVVSSFALALWPLTVTVDAVVELEPYLVFFVLLGGVLMFAKAGEASSRRLLAAGALIGFSCVVKAWGVLPAAATLLVWLPRWRRGGRWVVLGMAAGSVLPCLPFFIAAPHSFLHDIVTAQLARPAHQLSMALPERLMLISGLPGLPSASVVPELSIGNAFPFQVGSLEAIATVGFIVLLLAVVVLFGRRWRRRSPLEWWVLAVAAITFVGMFESPLLFSHYAYFPAALIAPLLGLCGAGLRIEAVSAGIGLWRRRQAPPARWRPAALGALPAIGAVVFLVSQNTSYAAAYLAESSPAPSLASYIPAGACVISDFPSDLTTSDRFTPSGEGCPAVVDPWAMYLADDGGLNPHPSPPYPSGFSLQWFNYLQRAQYVELRIPFSDFIPWQQFMIQWFNQNYVLVVHLHYAYDRPFVDSVKDIYVYRRIG